MKRYIASDAAFVDALRGVLGLSPLYSAEDRSPSAYSEQPLVSAQRPLVVHRAEQNEFRLELAEHLASKP